MRFYNTGRQFSGMQSSNPHIVGTKWTSWGLNIPLTDYSLYPCTIYSVYNMPKQHPHPLHDAGHWILPACALLHLGLTITMIYYFNIHLPHIQFNSYNQLSCTRINLFHCHLQINVYVMLNRKPAGCRHELCLKYNLCQNDLWDGVLQRTFYNMKHFTVQ